MPTQFLHRSYSTFFPQDKYRNCIEVYEFQSPKVLWWNLAPETWLQSSMVQQRCGTRCSLELVVIWRSCFKTTIIGWSTLGITITMHIYPPRLTSSGISSAGASSVRRMQRDLRGFTSVHSTTSAAAAGPRTSSGASSRWSAAFKN